MTAIWAVPETISIVTLVRPEMPIASRTCLGSTIRPTSSTVTVVFTKSSLPFGKQERKGNPNPSGYFSRIVSCWFGTHCKGRRALPKGEGVGEGFSMHLVRLRKLQPLTSVLSPCQGERRNNVRRADSY